MELTPQPPPTDPAPESPPSLTPVEPPSPRSLTMSYLFLAVVAATTTALDLGTKAWATRRLGNGAVMRVAEHLNFLLAHNKGGAGSFLSTTPDAFRLPFFLGVSAIAIFGMVVFYRKLLPHQWALRWGLPLMLGGALGNLADRVRFGSVVDFIQVYAKIGGQVRYWPTFNVADIAICIGVGLMALDLIQQTRSSMRTPAPHDQPTAG